MGEEERGRAVGAVLSRDPALDAQVTGGAREWWALHVPMSAAGKKTSVSASEEQIATSTRSGCGIRKRGGVYHRCGCEAQHGLSGTYPPIFDASAVKHCHAPLIQSSLLRNGEQRVSVRWQRHGREFKGTNHCNCTKFTKYLLSEITLLSKNYNLF